MHEAVANKVSVPFRDIGERQVKNIPNRVHAFVVAWPGLNPEITPEDRQGRRPARGTRSRAALAVLGGAGALVAAGIAFLALRPTAPSPAPPVEQAQIPAKRPEPAKETAQADPATVQPPAQAAADPAEAFSTLARQGGIVPDPKTAPELYHNARDCTRRAAMRSRRAAPTGRSRRSGSTISIRICATPPSCACRTGAPAPARSIPS